MVAISGKTTMDRCYDWCKKEISNGCTGFVAKPNGYCRLLIGVCNVSKLNFFTSFF